MSQATCTACAATVVCSIWPVCRLGAFKQARSQGWQGVALPPPSCPVLPPPPAKSATAARARYIHFYAPHCPSLPPQQ
jgi:hypothetical protein